MQHCNFNNQKFAVITGRVATDAFVRSAKAKPSHPTTKLYLLVLKICRQYDARVKVAVACAAHPAFRNFFTADAAAFLDANSPYSVEPEPDSDAYLAPARTNARLASPSSGYSGKTTCSKSFSIPARSSARSGFSARPLLKGAPEYHSLSQAERP